MTDIPMAPITPVKTPTKGDAPKGKLPTDAMQSGIHTDLRIASKHKKMVAPVLHLKRESAGHKLNPSAFNTGAKAFKPNKLKVK